MASQGTPSTSPEGRRTTPAPRPPPEQGLRCPRCDSSNTKFCYYNNYSLTQPRHFCKTCRRYWTKGGALRNVPVGGGCRKNKKTKASATALAITGGTIGANFLIPDHHKPSQVDQLFPFSKPNSSSANIISTSAGHAYNQFLTFGDLSPSSMACDNNIVASSCASSLESPGAIAQPLVMGFKPFDPISSPAIRQVGVSNSGVFAAGRIQEIGSANMQTHDIASSIESLRSMNQDLHFKLQQQRFASLLLGGGSQRETPSNSASLIENQQIHQQTISFHASGSSKSGGCGVEVGDKVQVASDNTTDQLLLESSYPTASEIQSWSGMRPFS